MRKSTSGFTLVELLIVIVVMAIIAAVSVVAYNGVQVRTTNAKLQTDLKSVQQKIELYYAEHGSYPATQSISITNGNWSSGVQAYADIACPYNFSDYNGYTITTKRADWVPEVNAALPQSNGQKRKNSYNTSWGCFIYQSDGVNYILSAWNMVAGGPQTDTMYRRLGFREMPMPFQTYHCNSTRIGGIRDAPYDPSLDFYKHSYTISNITTCNETPPPGV